MELCNTEQVDCTHRKADSYIQHIFNVLLMGHKALNFMQKKSFDLSVVSFMYFTNFHNNTTSKVKVETELNRVVLAVERSEHRIIL